MGGDDCFLVTGVGGAKRLNRGAGIVSLRRVCSASMLGCLRRNSEPRQQDRGASCTKRRSPMTRLHMLPRLATAQQRELSLSDLVQTPAMSIAFGSFRGVYPHTSPTCHITLRKSFPLSHPLDATSLINSRMVSDNFYPQPGMSRILSSWNVFS